ncbi:hypothetical protein EBL89_10915 [Cereibacter sphaeroides]|uniref:NnrU family protein n=1 Tax=Cereibacter sphaeroides TaxID=1063 RepID=UPI000F52ABF7|nr:NnrU family protein [Cereibacter sphaeroides]AZB55805.1 hypothetical protein EBL89_10915 [Cereibacter sphaeroides]AZB60067.1 hypothetical protein EBL88_10865 [Cereibacter sphaeroides]
MILLTLGIFLWVAGHLFKRVFPDLRARMGDPGKGLVTLIITAGLVLMIYGYRTADYVPVYVPLPDTGYLNNLLMLVAIVLLGAGVLKGVIWTRIRHPQFLATMIWATAHLLVNGDLAAILLFGSMWLWAAGSILLINTQEGEWVRPPPGPLRRDAVLVGIGLALYGAITSTHIFLDHNPFMGNYY